MTPQQLQDIGESIYGPHWQGPLAAALGMGKRGMQRWRAGQNPIPALAAANLRILERIAAEGRAWGDQRAAQAQNAEP